MTFIVFVASDRLKVVVAHIATRRLVPCVESSRIDHSKRIIQDVAVFIPGLRVRRNSTAQKGSSQFALPLGRKQSRRV